MNTQRFIQRIVFAFLIGFMLLLIPACGQTTSTPEAIEPAQETSQTAELEAELTPAPTETQEVVLDPTPTQEPTVEPTAEPTATVSNAPSDEELAGKQSIGEMFQIDSTGAFLTPFTNENINQFARELWATAIAVTVLEGGPYTVFAPTYNFEDIPAGTFASGTEFVDALRSHIVSGWYFEEDLIALDGQSIPTLLEGTDIQISVKNGDVYLNDVAMVIQPDILARNGVIHVIDQFLLPPAE